MPTDWLQDLLSAFPESPLAASDFEIIDAAAIPPQERALLDHHRHMTVTLEKHHGVSVCLHVHEVHCRGDDYARTLTLTSGPEGPVVMAGVMRFGLEYCTEDVRREIIEAHIPLGRILISHGVMRRLETFAFLRVATASEFAALLELDEAARRQTSWVYGRLAMIFCDEKPAVELLEVLPPQA